MTRSFKRNTPKRQKRKKERERRKKASLERRRREADEQRRRARQLLNSTELSVDPEGNVEEELRDDQNEQNRDDTFDDDKRMSDTETDRNALPDPIILGFENQQD